MPSSYSTNLGLELPATGEQAGLWGITTNTNLGTLLEQAISGYAQYACTGGTDTITIPNGATGVARNMALELTGTGGGTLEVPAKKKLYFIYNASSGAVTVKVTGQTGVSVPQNKKMLLVCNGTDVVQAVNYFASPTFATPALGTPASGVLTNTTGLPLTTGVTGTLPVANGGTGAASLTANNVLLGNGTSAVQVVAPGASGNVLTSNGTTWASTAATSEFPTGTALIFNQTSAPTGWTKSVTHNDKALRVVSGTVSNGGATAFSSVFGSGKATGSTAADLAAHTHTFTTASDGTHTHTYTNPHGSSNGTNAHISDFPNGADSASTATSSNGAHTHTGTTDSTGTGAGHTHTLSLDLYYVDVIIATKD